MANQDQQKVSSRRAAGYRQVTGFLPEEVIKKMRVKAAHLDLNQSEALEAALLDWVSTPPEEDPA